MTSETDANSKVTTDTGGFRNRLSSVTNANNNTTTYTYDALGRLTAKTDAGGTYASFLYDTAGNLISAANLDIAYTLRYDTAGRRSTLTYLTESCCDLHLRQHEQANRPYAPDLYVQAR